jgi:HlyD family secretion protein
LKKCRIINPVNGTVTAKYVERYEVVVPGKPLYKVADLSSLNLKAYVTGDQLPGLRMGQHVTVLADAGKNAVRVFHGDIIWIGDKAEFTPKTIQTREERANLVYPVKIKVKNDGSLKTGMYAEVKL